MRDFDCNSLTDAERRRLRDAMISVFSTMSGFNEMFLVISDKPFEPIPHNNVRLHIDRRANTKGVCDVHP